MHRHDHAQRRVHVLQFLAREAERDVVHSGPAILLRNRDAEQAERRHLRQDVGIETVGSIQLADPRPDFAACPLAHRLLQQPLFVVQIQIEHESLFVTEYKRRMLAPLTCE
jgi:hypothetical protein